jgi:hypothetical protein
VSSDARRHAVQPVSRGQYGRARYDSAKPAASSVSPPTAGTSPGTEPARLLPARRPRGGCAGVVVAGATGDGPLSIARIRAVAQEIVRATGPHIDIAGTTPSAVGNGLDPHRLQRQLTQQLLQKFALIALGGWLLAVVVGALTQFQEARV